jgi:hypothetical protein
MRVYDIDIKKRRRRRSEGEIYKQFVSQQEEKKNQCSLVNGRVVLST